MNIDPLISRANDRHSEVLTTVTTHEENANVHNDTRAAGFERWNKLPKPRGRQPKDPQGQSIRYQCRDIDDLQTYLRDHLEAPTAPAEHTTLEFCYPVSAAFMVYAADFKNRESNQSTEKQHNHLYGKLDRCAVSVIDALAPAEEPKRQMRRQKAIAKICVEACEKVDGFRYSFHNNWLSREDEACRFSYFCNDSTLNKGRAANEGKGTEGKKMRKPVYDCQGLIAIKFSQTKQSLEVHYKHIPLHTTYAERAPPPRKDSKRFKLAEIFDPETLQRRPSSKKQPELVEPHQKPRKRRALEIAGNNQATEEVGLTQEDGLQPLVHFLDSVDDHGDAQPSPLVHESVANKEHTRTIESASLDAASKRISQAAEPQKRPRVRRVVPGQLTVSFHKGDKVLSEDDGGGKTNPNTAVLQGIAEAARDKSDKAPLSDLEMLKAKLEEAEQRIRRLEAEKLQPQAQSQTWPPPGSQWPPPPPPSQWPYPYHYPPPYPFPNQVIHPDQYHQSPPHRTQVQGQEVSTTSQSAVENTLSSPAAGHSSSRPADTQQPTRAHTSKVRGFVPYVPRNSTGHTMQNTDSPTSFQSPTQSGSITAEDGSGSTRPAATTESRASPRAPRNRTPVASQMQDHRHQTDTTRPESFENGVGNDGTATRKRTP